MKKLIVILLAILLLVSCGNAGIDNSVTNNADESAEQTEQTENTGSILEDDLSTPSEVVLWQRNDTAVNCSKLSENVYSIDEELYIINNNSLEPISKTSEVLNLNGEAVQISVCKDNSNNLKCIDFSGANRSAIWIRANKAIIVDYYANQLFVFDAATNSVTPILSDKAYGFGCYEYEILTGKYDRIEWLNVPAVNNKGDRIVYWSNKYADNGIMSLNPGIWIVDLQAGSEYRLNLGELVPSVNLLNWIDNETLMFSTYSDECYKLNINTNKLEALDLPADGFITVSNGYAVYKTDNAVFVNYLIKNELTEYAITEPIDFDKVFERNGIIAFGNLKDGNVWTIDTETKSLDIQKVTFEENQSARLIGWSENGLVIEVLDINKNEITKICVMPAEGLK